MLMFSGDGCRKRKAGEVEEDQVNDFFLCDCWIWIYPKVLVDAKALMRRG